MTISRLLEEAPVVKEYQVLDYRKWQDGFYYKVAVTLKDDTLLYAREYNDPDERNYSYHWQDPSEQLIIRWDNAPHHPDILTHPHHKHTPIGVSESQEITLEEVLTKIEKVILSP